MYPFPRYWPIVRALVGDSTIISLFNSIGSFVESDHYTEEVAKVEDKHLSPVPHMEKGDTERIKCTCHERKIDAIRCF